MKHLLLCLIVCKPLFVAAQSVPTGNFENWNVVDGVEAPEHWTTDNTEINTTVSPDLDAFEGQYAMRVTAQPYPLGLYGEASTLFEIGAIPEALNFYAKWATAFGGVSVKVDFMNEETTMYSENWFGTDSMPDYELISIPLEQIEPVITHARITVSALVGDLVPGTAWISVDAMDFGQPMAVQQADRQGLKLYPNPAREYVILQTESENLGHISIFDALGRRVYDTSFRGAKARINVQDFPKGVYTVLGRGNGGFLGRFVVGL